MSPALKGHVAMLVFSALVAGSFALGGLVANEITPAALNAIRFWMAVIIVGAAVAATGGVPRAALSAPWRYLVLGGLFAIYFFTMFEGLKTALPVSTAAVFTLTPIMSGVFGWILLRQVTTPRMALALAIGAVGALWVIFRADLSALLTLDVGRGEVIFFFGCIAHAAYTPLVRKLNRGETTLVFVLGTLVAGGLWLTILGWAELRATDWANLSGMVWITLAYLAVFASSGSFVLLQFASLRLPSAKVMAYTYLVPSWVIGWEVAMGNEVPQPLILVGVILTVVALLMLLRDDEARG